MLGDTIYNIVSQIAHDINWPEGGRSYLYIGISADLRNDAYCMYNLFFIK